MPPPPRKQVEVILARELAAHVASPMLVVDGEGTLVHLNDAAEALLGVRFGEVGELALEVWSRRWLPDETEEVPLGQLPLARAMLEHRPAHHALTVRTAAGPKRVLVTAYPLRSTEGAFLGAVAIFWEPDAD